MKKKKDCPHCDKDSFALEQPLKETENFRVVCDVHPIIEGHILIIPKEHISCIGEYNSKLLKEFDDLYLEITKFLKLTYGKVSSFEHGVIGQTVFHSHTHLIPYSGKPESIVSEGLKYLIKLDKISDLKEIFKKDRKYLFFSIGKDLWAVDVSIGKPRFFRDRFAIALGRPERANWKQMRANKSIMELVGLEIKNLKKKWGNHSFR